MELIQFLQGELLLFGSLLFFLAMLAITIIKTKIKNSRKLK